MLQVYMLLEAINTHLLVIDPLAVQWEFESTNSFQVSYFGYLGDISIPVFTAHTKVACNCRYLREISLLSSNQITISPVAMKKVK